MAVRKDLLYPGRWNPSNADFPLGGPKNRTAPGAQDGSYFDNAWIKDYEAFFGRLMTEGGVTANETPDTANTSQFFEAFSNTKSSENRFKGNQNWNVAGSTTDPLPDGTPKTYAVGSEVAAGVEVITSDAEQVTYVSGVLNSGNNTGILRRRYAKDSAGLITKSTQYGGIKLADGSQLQAIVDDIVTNGVRITEDGSDVVVDVDLSVITGGFEFFGLSDTKGKWQRINEDESYIAQTGMRFLGRAPVRVSDSYEIDPSGKISYYLSSTLTTTIAGNWTSANINLPFIIPNGVLSKLVTMDAPNSNQGLEVAIELTLSVVTVYFRSDSPTTQELTIKIEAY